MNWHRSEDNWKQFKGNVKQQWGKLSDDQFAGKIQKMCGISKDETEKPVSVWQEHQKEMGRLE